MTTLIVANDLVGLIFPPTEADIIACVGSFIGDLTP